MPDNPPDPSKDQAAMRLRDLNRLRDLIRLHGHDGALHIPTLPQPARREAEELLDRLGDLNSRRHEQRQKILTDIAHAESYLTDLDSPQARRLRRDFAKLRSKLTGLAPDPDESQP